MGIFRLHKEQKINTTMEKAWQFFSNPHNLKLITPPQLGLNITSENSGEIYPGMIITYDLNLVSFLKTCWVTEISHVDKPFFFVDEQKVGPYSFWHHKHYFSETDNGEITVKDVVDYAVPLGPAGKIINRLYIRKNLEHIFEYRANVLDRIFSSKI